MLTELQTAAAAVGITTVIATSDRNINDQLNRIVREENLPIALITWDLNVNLVFNESGHLQNPDTKVTMLIVDKANTNEKIDLENKAEEVGKLFIKFIRVYRNHLVASTNVKETPITNISFVYTPSYGSGKHSGVLATFNTQMPLDPDC